MVQETEYYSTDKAEQAQEAYRRACSDAEAAVRAQLRQLATTLQVSLPSHLYAPAIMLLANALALNV